MVAMVGPAAGWAAIAGDRHLLHVVTIASIWSLWGISLNLVWGFAGQFSMLAGGLGAISSYGTAIAIHDHGWRFWAAAPVAVVGAAAVSALVGLASLRLSDFYLSIMTLVCSLLILSVAGQVDMTGGPSGMSMGYDLGVLDIGPVRWDLGSRAGGFLLLVVLTVAVVLLLIGCLRRSRPGRAMVSIREDQVLASALGVAVWRYKVLAFTVSGAVAGMAGIWFAAYLRFITPGFFGLDLLVNSILIVVIGGSGFLFGPVVGAAAYAILSEGVRAAGDFEAALLGALLIVVVLFLPSGVTGGARDVLAARRRQARARG